MLFNEKLITSKNLKIGQVIQGYNQGTRSCLCTKIVKSINPFKIGIAWESCPDKIEYVDAENTLWRVELTEKEFYQKYYKKGKDIYKSFYNKLLPDQMGCHEQWNAWLEYDAFFLAAKCEEYKIRIIGHSTDIVPRLSWTGTELNVGVCAEHIDTGERFWCHASNDIFDYMDRSLIIADEIIRLKNNL